MKKVLRSTVIFLAILAVVSFTLNAFALPNSGKNFDIKNLEKYNFDNQGSQKSQYSSVFTIIKFIGFLVLFIVISILAYYFTKFLARNTSFLYIKSKYMEVIDVLPLGNKTNLYLVKLPTGYFILGNSEKGISIVGKLDEKEVELIKEAEALSAEAGKRFASQLEIYLKKIRNPFGSKDGDENK